jgi:predicted RNA-binding protein with RPS1 domain
MNPSLYEHAAAWCDGAADALQRGRQALLEFNEQDRQAAPAFAALVAQAKQNPNRFDSGLLSRGAAAMLQAFEDLVFDRLSYNHFAGFDHLKSAAALIGASLASTERPAATTDTLIKEFDALGAELRELSQASLGSHASEVTSAWSAEARNQYYAEIDHSQQASIQQLKGRPLPDLLKTFLAMPIPTPSSRNPLLYVPKDKRDGRWKVALWTLGILGLIALFSGNAFFWIIFLGTLGYFIASAVVTQQAEADEGNRAGSIKDKLKRLDSSACDLFARTALNMGRRLEEAAKSATDLCRPTLDIARNATHEAVQQGDFVLGVCAVTPLIDSVTIAGVRPSFASYAAAKQINPHDFGNDSDIDGLQVGRVYDGKVVKIMDFGAFVNFHGSMDGLVHVSELASTRVTSPRDVVKEGQTVKVRLLGFDDRGKVRLSMKEVNQLTGQGIDNTPTNSKEPESKRDDKRFYVDGIGAEPTPLDGCFARFSLSDCDSLEAVLEGRDDVHALAGRALTAAVLDAVTPGQTRFMFIEPGRLAETYRVFGSLNETPATRVADRLYITHINELSSAVDALRTFIGRTKEAMTRRSDQAQRITERNAEDKNAIILPRAIVVLDRTEEPFWPEKDKRRISEYYDEIRSLSEVGSREGSVFLIYLRRSNGPSQEVPCTTDRHISLRVRRNSYLLQGNERVRGTLLTATDAASKCDLWCKQAKKADGNLRQQESELDWSDAEASDTRYGLEVEIGRHGAGRPARLALGREGIRHAICIGRTGSGKTNLFHVIIGNLVRRYSPEELELYLLDFKEGVEFAVYAGVALPHCRVVAIDADRGFGLSVLSHLRRELNRRANIFKNAGVGITSLERYEETTGKNMPRILLLIDEFQVLLQGERTAGAATGAAAAALEDLVRRGGSFGLHVILGSQTLAGRELTAATLGQLAARIVLPCSAPDATMLLGDQPISNQLRTPGDAIVWTAGQGNVSDSHLAKIYAANLGDLPELADTSRKHIEANGGVALAPFVFRGSGQNELSEVMPHLQAARAEGANDGSALFALGAPTAYGERAIGKFENRRARNCLLVHRADEARAGFFYSALESLLKLQVGCQAIICDLDGFKDLEDKPMINRISAAFGNRARVVQPADLDAAVSQLVDSLSRRDDLRTILAINGAGRTNLIRSPGFAKLLREGPEMGCHVLVTCDSVRNLERVIERPMVPEFGIRGLGPAPAGDSQRLIDANDAEALSADHQYLLLDDSAVGRLTRLQVLTSTFERGAPQDVPEQEVANA